MACAGMFVSATVEAVALAGYAKDLGAGAVMATPTYFSQVTERSVRDHFLWS